MRVLSTRIYDEEKKDNINRKDRNDLYCEVWEVVVEPVCLYVVVLCI